MSTDWRTACAAQAEATSRMAAASARLDYEDEILARIDKFAHWVKKGWEPHPSTFTMIGAYALLLLEHESCDNWGVERITDILCSKQHDYGPGNISKFGTIGIMVRMSDKAERLRNLRARDADPQNESLVDTLFDILGYSIVALMWMEGTFLLDLIVEEPKIIHDPSPAQLEEFFAAPEVAYKPSIDMTPAEYRWNQPYYRGQQLLPAEMQWKPKR